MQTKNPLFDEFAQMMNTAMGAAQSMGEEAQAVFRSQMERLIADMDLARREEIETLKGEVEALRDQNAALSDRVTALEAGSDPAGDSAENSAEGFGEDGPAG